MKDTQRVVLGVVIAAVVAFAIGAGWQFSSARAYRGELETTRTQLDTAHYELTFRRLEATLGAATIEAQRGNHESARRLASDFFSSLQTAIPTAPASAQPALQQIQAERDAMITELSRANLESGGLLAATFDRYRVAMGEPVGPIPAPSGQPPAGDTTTPAQTTPPAPIPPATQTPPPAQ
jgi:hypothetical protein